MYTKDIAVLNQGFKQQVYTPCKSSCQTYAWERPAGSCIIEQEQTCILISAFLLRNNTGCEQGGNLWFCLLLSSPYTLSDVKVSNTLFTWAIVSFHSHSPLKLLEVFMPDTEFWHFLVTWFGTIWLDEQWNWRTPEWPVYMWNRNSVHKGKKWFSVALYQSMFQFRKRFWRDKSRLYPLLYGTEQLRSHMNNAKHYLSEQEFWPHIGLGRNQYQLTF